jgi:hypothetical protein
MMLSSSVPINSTVRRETVVHYVGGSGIVYFYCLCINAACGLMVIVMFSLGCMVIILTILTLNDVSHKNLSFYYLVL